MIGFVGQEPVLFSGSIRENLAYGRHDKPATEPSWRPSLPEPMSRSSSNGFPMAGIHWSVSGVSNFLVDKNNASRLRERCCATRKY